MRYTSRKPILKYAPGAAEPSDRDVGGVDTEGCGVATRQPVHAAHDERRFNIGAGALRRLRRLISGR